MTTLQSALEYFHRLATTPGDDDCGHLLGPGDREIASLHLSRMIGHYGASVQSRAEGQSLTQLFVPSGRQDKTGRRPGHVLTVWFLVGRAEARMLSVKLAPRTLSREEAQRLFFSEWPSSAPQ